MKFNGKVIHGQKHGRTIGYPTANIEMTDVVKQALEKEGVYAVKVRTEVGEYGGALFYGQRTLFKEDKLVCEILLLDFTDDIYEQETIVEVIKYLRPVEPVKNEEALKRLIEQDIKDVKSII